MKPGSPILVTACYALAGTLWIVVSDLIVRSLPASVELQTPKGLLFIAVTSLVIYWLVRRLESARNHTVAFQQAMIEASPIAMYSIDLNGQVLSWNRAAESIFGWTSHEVIGHPLPTVPGDKEHEFIELRRQTSAGESLSSLEVTRLRRDGTRFEGSLSTAPIVNPDGEITAILATMEDITERKAAEDALRESEQRFRDLVDGAPDGIIIQIDGRFAYVNRAFANLIGASKPEDLVGMKIADVIHPDDVADATERMRLLSEKRQPLNQIEQSMITLQGDVIPVENAAVPFRYQGRDGGLGFVRDIRRRREGARARERMFQTIEQASEAVVIIDDQGLIEYVNPAFERSSGYSRKEVIGLESGFQSSGLHDDEFFKGMWETISSGQVWRGRIVNRHKEGVLYTEDVSITPVFDPAGQIINYAMLKRDVTHELNLQHQLNQAQKMETVGRLAGGVAHDFNNMLSVILGYTELAMGKLEQEDEVSNDLVEVQAAAHRSADLTRQLLGFARQQMIQPEVIDLNQAVWNITKMLERLIGEDIELVWKPGRELWPVLIDPTQVDQILANLAVNARDAIEGHGTITVMTGNVEVGPQEARAHPGLEQGQYVRLSFTDTGNGISDAVKTQIFEPFFTTKVEGTGTGLGLSTVYGIVKQNGGFIDVDSEPGDGTTFRIFFPPFLHTDAAADKEPDVNEASCAGTETILLVEDEDALLKLGQRILERSGYRVLATSSPLEAIRLASDLTNEIDLLLTDLVMPEMNGHELWLKIKDNNADIRVLFTSGYTGDTVLKDELFSEHEAFMQKPYTTSSLPKKVREVLDNHPTK